MYRSKGREYGTGESPAGQRRTGDRPRHLLSGATMDVSACILDYFAASAILLVGMFSISRRRIDYRRRVRRGRQILYPTSDNRRSRTLSDPRATLAPHLGRQPIGSRHTIGLPLL